MRLESMRRIIERLDDLGDALREKQLGLAKDPDNDEPNVGILGFAFMDYQEHGGAT